jgi:hypothetical protein
MLISEGYRAQNRKLMETDPSYAISGHAMREMIRQMSDWGRKEILDYGCGRKLLQFALGPAYTVHNYDPAVPDCDTTPEPADVVYCGDVLEHVEPDCIDDVLRDLRRVVKGTGLFRICLVASSKTLEDGRNAHLMVKSNDWWRENLIWAGFTILKEKPKHEISTITWFMVK